MGITAEMIVLEGLKILSGQIGAEVLDTGKEDKKDPKNGVRDVEFEFDPVELGAGIDLFTSVRIQPVLEELGKKLKADGLEPNANQDVPPGVGFGFSGHKNGRRLRLLGQYDLDSGMMRCKFSVRHAKVAHLPEDGPVDASADAAASLVADVPKAAKAPEQKAGDGAAEKKR